MTAQRTATAIGLSMGFLPYIAGGCLVFFTQQVSRFVIVGILITLFCTTGAYVIRKRSKNQYAAQRLIIDPFLYGFEFAFTAVLVHYMFASPR